jgi:ATP-dependent Clp protease adaptor protein ClpS
MGGEEEAMSRWKDQKEGQLVTETRTRQKTKKPSMYRVLLHNDDFTTMEFVVAVLQAIFHLSETDAVNVMLHIHRRGMGVAGVYTHEIAENKVAEVTSAAEKAEFPLLCTMEPDESSEDK